MAFSERHGPSKRLPALTPASQEVTLQPEMEGFNCKLRTLIKMANGYKDEEFFKMKIFDLPDQKIVDLTCPAEDRNALRQKIIYELSTT